MERVMRMLDRDVQSPKRILEINPKHPFIQNLGVLAGQNEESEQVKTLCELLFDQALLAEGVMPETQGLLKRMQNVMTWASGVTK